MQDDSTRNAIILACVMAYMIMCVAVGLWAMRRTKSAKDFFMAGRSLGPLVVALAVFSSTLSAFGFVGGPGLVYRMGMSSVWMIICSTIGYAISFFLLAKRIRVFAEYCDSVSLPDVVAARYGSESTRFLTAVAILFGVVGYLGTQVLGMAEVLEEILVSQDFFTRFADGMGRRAGDLLNGGVPIEKMSLHICMILSVAVLVFYCVTGGIIASVYTDVVQGGVMILAAVLIFFTAVNAVDGGIPAIAQTIHTDDPEAMSPWGTIGMMGALSWYFIFAIGGAGQPHVITKMMMNKKISDAKRILPLTLAGYSVCALLWISIGLAMRALVIQGAHPELDGADSAAPRFLQSYASPLLAGIVFAGLFAAIMSTADGFLNIGAAAIVHDIPRALVGRSMPNELFAARAATFFIAVSAAAFALWAKNHGNIVGLLGAFGWGTFAAALVPGVAIGFNWRRANAAAVNTAIVSSLVINFAIKAFPEHLSPPWGIDGGAVSLLISLTLFFLLSFALPPKKINPDIDELMGI